MQCSNSSICLSREVCYLAKLTKFYKMIDLVFSKVEIESYSFLV
jgi:hypothetical protein